MYFALTGRPPFRADRSLAILNRICNDRHRPVREVNPDVPPPVAAIVDRLLEKDPSARFQSGEEVRYECLHLLSDPESLFETESQSTDAVAARHVRTRTAAYLAVLLVLIVASFGRDSLQTESQSATCSPCRLRFSSGTAFEDGLPRKTSSGTTFEVDSLNTSPSRAPQTKPKLRNHRQQNLAIRCQTSNNLHTSESGKDGGKRSRR